jgi:hypothetical protein
MQKFVLFFFIALASLVAACRHQEPEPSSYPDKIVLRETQLVGDSVALSWTKLDNADLVSYRVLRRLSPTDPGTPISSYQQGTSTTFTDKLVPYTPYVEYQVVAIFKNTSTSPATPINSNSIKVQRPNIKVVANSPFDVQFDRRRRQLYFFERSGTISQYSLTSSEITKSVASGATIGYSDFATYNGVPELYVPRNDGWVFIYNAETLEKIDQLNVGTAATCVVANNGYLFVSTATWQYNALKVYNRAAKMLVNQTGDWYSTRFKRVPGSNTELVEMTLTIGPPDQHYYSFSGSSVQTHFADRYHGDHPVDATIFELFPNGAKYLTSSEGAIYSKVLTYEGTLPHGNLAYTSFCFDAAGQTICAGTTTRTIEQYNANTYALLRSIPTKAYPYRLFEDGSNGYVCVSSVTPLGGYSSLPYQLTIEQVR